MKFMWPIVLTSAWTVCLYIHNRISEMAGSSNSFFRLHAKLLTVELISCTFLSFLLYMQVMSLLLSKKSFKKDSRRNQVIRRIYQIWSFLDFVIGAVVFFFLYQIRTETNINCPFAIVDRIERVVLLYYVGASIMCSLLSSTFMINMTNYFLGGANWNDTPETLSGAFFWIFRCCPKNSDRQENADSVGLPSMDENNVTSAKAQESKDSNSFPEKREALPVSTSETQNDLSYYWSSIDTLSTMSLESSAAVWSLVVIFFIVFLLYYNIQLFSLLKLHSLILDCQENILDKFPGGRLALGSSFFMTNSFLTLLLFTTAISVVLMETTPTTNGHRTATFETPLKTRTSD